MCAANFQLLFLAFLVFTQLSTAAPSLIPIACNITRAAVDHQQCITALQSQPAIASATRMKTLAIRILQTGFQNSTKTRDYIKQLKTINSDGGGLKECEESYDLIIPSFRSAMGEVDEDDYDSATYDLLLAGTDYLSPCENATAVYGIRDEIVLQGNKAVEIFAFAAYTVADALDSQMSRRYHTP